jgi:hypothetical protein
MEKVPRCCRELPPQAKFHNQQNSLTSKIWWLVERRQNHQILPTDTKIGLDERKRKGAKVRGQEFATLKICHPQNLPPRPKNYKSVKMIINYGG